MSQIAPEVDDETWELARARVEAKTRRQARSGPGLRRYLFNLLRAYDRPMTLADIWADAANPQKASKTRAEARAIAVRLQDAIRGLVDDGTVLTIGVAGDPQRYCINPLTDAIAGDEKNFERVRAMLDRNREGTRRPIRPQDVSWRSVYGNKPPDKAGVGVHSTGPASPLSVAPPSSRRIGGHLHLRGFCRALLKYLLRNLSVSYVTKRSP